MTLPTVLIISPFRNEDHSVPHYLKALAAIDYPHELIDVYWMENDSSDNTLKLLENSKDSFNFNSLTLDPVIVIGQVKKNKPTDYYKDLSYGLPRRNAWMTIWNDIFLPKIRESTQDYVLMWYSDALPPPNVIHEYLKVFKDHPAGWVGGSLVRRLPLRPNMRSHVESPWPMKIMNAKKITRCELTGHVWMMPRDAIAASECNLHPAPREIHFSLIYCLEKQGLYVYYQPSIYMPHVSMDGKVHHPEPPWK